MNNFCKNILILVLFLIFGGILSVVLRFWPDFDFYSYHYYNGYAFLNNRIDIDFMPATFRTYFNPVLDGISFYLIRALNSHPDMFFFIGGLKYGLFMFLSYLFFNKLFRFEKQDKLVAIVAGLLFVFFSPLLFLTIGIDWTDIQIACFILISLYLYMDNIFKEPSKKRSWLIFLSALLIGLATGLKYTAFIFGITLFICLFINHKNIKGLLKLSLILFSGMFIGFIVTDGFWLYTVWKHFGNPMFPYFNNIFHSNLGVSSAVLDSDFGHIRPNSLYSLLVLPLGDTTSNNVGTENGFFDLKIALTFFLIAVYLLFRIQNQTLKEVLNKIIDEKQFNLMITIIIVSFYLNAIVFGQARYILALIPFSVIVMIACAYIYSHYIQKAKLNFYFLLFLALFFFISYIFVADFYILQPLIFLIYVLMFVCMLKTYYSSKLSGLQKIFYMILIMTVFAFIGTTKMNNSYMIEPRNKMDKLVDAEDLKIEDDAVVFGATMTSGFIVPNQNPKAKYYAYPLQDKYKYLKYSMMKFKDLSLLEYTSPYLVQLFNYSLDKEDNVYVVIGYQDIDYAHDKCLDIYKKSLIDYMGKDAKPFAKCKTTVQTFYPNSQNEYMICKLK